MINIVRLRCVDSAQGHCPLRMDSLGHGISNYQMDANSTGIYKVSFLFPSVVQGTFTYATIRTFVL